MRKSVFKRVIHLAVLLLVLSPANSPSFLQVLVLRAVLQSVYLICTANFGVGEEIIMGNWVLDQTPIL